MFPLGSEGCEFISEMLKSNTTLKKLILSSNLIDDDGVHVLADGLSVNDTLSSLVRFIQHGKRSARIS